MASINSILQARTKQSEGTNKMKAMAKQSANGSLTSFAGVFGMSELSETEKTRLAEILKTYASDDYENSKDLEQLTTLTAEVKAINNQAALLHGERIKKAHHILTNYRDGAFTAWLISTYGNRQTPYNLMQYYEFYELMPKNLRTQIEMMPRQAIYVLATRMGDLQIKQEIVEKYQGQSKAEMLALIREKFPLDIKDRRKAKDSPQIIQQLYQLCIELETKPANFSLQQKKQICKYLETLHKLLGDI